MRIGVIHLTDCHIDDGNEPFLNRVDDIAKTVRAVKKADAWALLFSGDLSNAGASNQLQRALKFLGELQTAVAKMVGAEPRIIAIPGNHDCNISSEKERVELTNRIRAGETDGKDELLLAQAAFWGAFPIPSSPSCNSKMAFLSPMGVNDETVAIVGVNSSWMSDLHETQGGLVFQPEWFDHLSAWIHQNEPDVVISLIHHPLHWQQEGLQKSLWHKLARVTDILLTGHEHEPDGFVRSTGCSSIAVFEGGVLSQHSIGYEHSNFQIIHIDTGRNEIERTICSWESSIGQFRVERYQQAFQVNTARVRNALRPQWLEEIEGSMLEACHTRKNPVRLSEYFVWPHARWVDRTKHIEPKLKTADEFLELLSQKNFLRIKGAVKSGKTALLRQLVPLLKRKGFTPILVDAARADTAAKALKDSLAAQYVDLSVDTLHAAKNTVLLIDDWEHLRLRIEKRLEFIEELLQACSYCVLTTSVSTDVEYLSSGRTCILDAFQDLMLEPLSRSKRSELLIRWASIAAPLEMEEHAIEREVEQGNDKISTILGENLVPASPIITVTLWQELQSGVASTQGVGSNGHLYKHLVEYSLKHSAIKATEIGWDQRYSFLGFLAIAMFEKKATLTQADVRAVKTAFVKEICLEPDLDAVISDCCNIGLLREKDERLCFAFEFGLYYFTAYYIHEHREVEGERISKMVNNLYAFDNTQTIIFYLYISSDAKVMTDILAIAEGFLAKADEFTFAQLPQTSKTLTDAVKPRLIERGIDDRPSFDAVVVKAGNHDAEIRDIVLARRLSFILGQVVSNFPAKVASRIGAERRDNFLRQAYRLELVALANSLRLLTNHAQEFLQHLRYHISYDATAKRTKHEEDEILQWAIPALLHFMVVQSVLEVPARLCSKDLISVHDKIADGNGPHNRIYTVINTAIRIDQSSTYPTNLVLERAQEFAKAKDGSWHVLRDVVYFSMLKFKRNYRVRQQMCQEFELGDSTRLLLEEG